MRASRSLEAEGRAAEQQPLRLAHESCPVKPLRAKMSKEQTKNENGNAYCVFDTSTRYRQLNLEECKLQCTGLTAALNLVYSK